MGLKIGRGDEKDDRYDAYIRKDFMPDIPQVYHFVQRYGYYSLADEEYELQAGTDAGIYIEIPIEDLLSIPDEAFASRRAQHYYAGCDFSEIPKEGYGCTFAAQYDEYVAELSAYVHPETISFDDFNELMKEVDRIMVEHLGATRPDGSTEPAQNELTMWLEKKRAEDMEQSTPEPLLDYLLFPWNQTLIQPASPLFTPAGEVQVTSTP